MDGIDDKQGAAPASPSLRKRARLAYEGARLRRAARFIAVVAPMTALAFFVCGETTAVLICGVLLAVASVGFAWRGQGWGRGVWPGLVAGGLSAALPLTAHALGFCCRFDLEVALCVASGVIAGVAVAILARRGAASERLPRLLGGALVATLAGSLGCLAIGVGGALAVAAGAAAIAMPVVAWESFAGAP